MTKSEKAHRLIPGGAHTYSKGDDQFPANAPRFLERGSGAYVWDDRGERYLDWTMGLRTMTLGYGFGEVDEAAIAQIRKGLNFGRPSLIETELAEELVELIPCAEMVKFAKNGSTVTTAAVKLARAYTGRPYVAVCQDHPFFSFDDWFIGTTPCDGGIPKEQVRFSLPFRYNDIASLKNLFERYPGQIAAVILEPVISDPPRDGFLNRIRELCNDSGTVFILDEMITGFRWDLQGASKFFGVEPDLATFGKGIANGYSVSVLAGRRDLMKLGGLSHEKKRVFLISTTHGAENSGLAAARAALSVFRREPVIPTLWRIGQSLIEGLNRVANSAGIGECFVAKGYGCRPEFTCLDQEGKASLPLRTLFLQEMVKQGVLINYIVPSYVHGDKEVEMTLTAAQEAFSIYAQALNEGVHKYLVGPVIKPVFRAFN